MQEWLTMMAALAPVFGVIGVGVVVRRINWLTEEADRTLISLCVRLLFPCFALYQMNQSEWLSEPAGLLIPPGAGFALTAIGFAVCWIIARTMGSRLGLTTPAHRRTFVLCAGICNYGYIPIPLVAQLFRNGREMPTLLLHNVGVDIALWTLGMLILAGRLGRRWWLGVLNPMVIAILLALLLKFTGGWASLKDHAMPAIKLVSLLADCAIPLSLLLSGATIADVWREADFREGWGVLWSSAVLRLGLIPAIFVGLTLLIPLDLPLKHVIAIQAAMPAAVFPIILARHYGGDPPTAVRVVLGTHLLSLLTCPMWLALAL